MIRRIDVVKNEYGEFEMIYEGEILTSSSKLKNWIIEIKDNQLFCIGLSNANKTNERIKIYKLEEGSLFLMNSSYNWYSYFRKKDVQKKLDKYNIIKCKNCNEFVKIVIDSEDAVIKTYGYKLKDVVKNVTLKGDDEQTTLSVYSLIFKKDYLVSNPFILQRGKNEESYILYMDNQSDIENIELENAKIFDIKSKLKLL